MKSETNDHADVAPDDTIEDAAPPPSSSSTRGDVDMQALGGATTTTATSAEVPTTDAADDDHDEDVEGDENHMDPDAVAAATVAASYVISVDPNSPHPGELAGASSKVSEERKKATASHFSQKINGMELTTISVFTFSDGSLRSGVRTDMGPPF
jgi:hypothetical protein